MYTKGFHVYICVCVYIHIYTHTLFKIVFHYRLLQDNEYSSLCCIGGPYWLSILYIAVCIFSFQPPNLFLPCALFP